jgi:UDP-N-acetylmuramoyl-L-alanyl-D-glutamate--2,6-diaminopimelate ligase
MNAVRKSGGAADAAGNWRPLKALLGGAIEVPERVEISDLTVNSQEVRPGAAFLACAGVKHHGLEFAAEAVERGARAILWEPAAGVTAPEFERVVVAAVPNLRAQLGYIADRFFDAPSAALTIAGITGTNGKTTCAWLLAQAASLCGRGAAYIGTLGAGRPEALTPGTHTTPDAVTLQRLLAQQRGAGAQCLGLEVSSHALEQQRCNGIRFHTAVFTNLTRDHLDYHGDMDAYGRAKERLFDWATLAVRVINVDDNFGADLARRASHGARLVLTGRRVAESLPGAEFVGVRAVSPRADGTDIEIASSWGSASMASPLLGDFNVDNMLSVLAVLLAWDVPLAAACRALTACTAPPGRMQRLGGGPRPLVIVDYAHTPDALEKALRAARVHCTGRLWCVFGCGGERDSGKRAAMGRVAETFADAVIVTDDNPRGEDPDAIVDAITAGMHGGITVLHDRAQAIHRAIAAAGAGDVVLIAGKGHEPYQIIGTRRLPFSDAVAAGDALAASLPRRPS